MKKSLPDPLSALRVSQGQNINLQKISTDNLDGFDNEDVAKAQLKEDAKAINELQDRLYAEGKRSLLVILQGTDTSGKDGTIRAVFNETGPLGVNVTAFRRPSEEELAHDFLWRAHLACPKHGHIGLFNRSHYEDVLIAKVRALAEPRQIEQRYDQINQFEKMLVENGTTILKFMLHISKEEQRERLQERLDDPKKNWKFNAGDLDDRKLWPGFTKAYELMLERCSTPHAPWYIIPADKKWIRSAVIAKIVRQALEEMNPQYPKPKWKAEDFKIPG
jgi:PPK2 family polyphosphate:nucleotide phosphotransferase